MAGLSIESIPRGRCAQANAEKLPRGPPDWVVSAASGFDCDVFVQLCEKRAAIAYTIGGHLDLCQQNRGISPVIRT
jgi:hypothetical protein